MDISFPDHADEGELSSGSALFTMREEEVCIAGGAEIDPEDLILLDSFLLDLDHVNPGQVHHPLPIPFRNRVGLQYGMEYSFINLVTADTNGRSQSDQEILARTTERFFHGL